MPKVGMRMIKTSIAVFLCFLVDLIRQDGVPFYSAIAAVLCMQSEITDSKAKAKSRIIATIIGGVAGMVFLHIENSLPFLISDWIRYFAISVCLIPILYFTVIIKKPSSSYLSCVVFMCITVAHVDDSNATIFAINRILDTIIGIVISLGVNQFHIPTIKKEDIYVLPIDNMLSIYKQNNYHIKKCLHTHPNSILYSSKIPALLFDNILSLPLSLPVIVMDGAAIFDTYKKQYVSLQVIPQEVVNKIQELLTRYKIHYFCYELNQEQLLIHYQQLEHPKVIERYNQTKHTGHMHYVHHHNAYDIEHAVLCFEIIGDIDIVNNIEHELNMLPVTCYCVREKDCANLKVYTKGVSIDNQVSCIQRLYQLQDKKIHVLKSQEIDFSVLKHFFKGVKNEK